MIAILCSDLHFSQKKPVARGPEQDWYDAMERQFSQLRKTQRTLEAPVVIAGDIFDRWNSPAELINFANSVLPKECYAIPGQHDLPNHNYSDKKRSAYHTLTLCGNVCDFVGPFRVSDSLVLHGFPWGHNIEPHDFDDDSIHLAVVHAYIHTRTTGFPGAGMETRVAKYKQELATYDTAVFGDNHKGFLSKNILNSGAFLRRSIAERDYVPCVGLLYSDGTIERRALDVSDDRFVSVEEAVEMMECAIDLSDFTGALKGLQQDSIAFTDIVKRFLRTNDIVETVSTKVLEALHGD